MRRRLLFLLLLFALAFSVRLTYILLKRTYLEPGAAEMERAAASLADHGMLGNVYAADSGPSAHVAPLYPLFLSLIYRLFGSNGWTGRLAQEITAILISSCSISLLPAIARRANLAPAAGWIAAIMLAMLPLNLWVETSGAWEQPAAALLLLAIFWTVLALQERQWQASWLVLLLGMWTGMAALLSPTLLPAVALMLLAEFVTRVASRKPMLRAAPLLFVPVILCVGPWAARNHRVLGGWVALRSNFGLELWLGNHPGSNGRSFDIAWNDRNSFIYQNHPYLNRQELLAVKEMGELEYMRAKQRQATEWIRANPGEFAALCSERFRLFWFPPPDFWDPTAPRVNVLKAICYSLFAVGMFGELLCLLFTRHAGRFLWIAALLGPSLVYLATHVDARYRYPVFALSALMCCSLMLRGLRAFATQKSRWDSARLRTAKPGIKSASA